jgi:hypothetical protein
MEIFYFDMRRLPPETVSVCLRFAAMQRSFGQALGMRFYPESRPHAAWRQLAGGGVGE